MREELLRLPGGPVGRPMWMWRYGHYGLPVVAFPTAGGYAHEWQERGMVAALRPLIEAGRIKLYCPETNVAEAWVHGTAPPGERAELHGAYERWVLEHLVPWIREDCRTPDIRMIAVGASMGAIYAANMTLGHPEVFSTGICLSGRYELGTFTESSPDPRVWGCNPMTWHERIDEERLARIRHHAQLVLVCGQGAFESNCLRETLTFSQRLRGRGVPHQLDVWGREVAHEWPWWHRQVRHHLERRV
jgi:esterase/lipase superfamily enzyme